MRLRSAGKPSVPGLTPSRVACGLKMKENPRSEMTPDPGGHRPQGRTRAKQDQAQASAPGQSRTQSVGGATTCYMHVRCRTGHGRTLRRRWRVGGEALRAEAKTPASSVAFRGAASRWVHAAQLAEPYRTAVQPERVPPAPRRHGIFSHREQRRRRGGGWGGSSGGRINAEVSMQRFHGWQCMMLSARRPNEPQCTHSGVSLHMSVHREGACRECRQANQTGGLCGVGLAAWQECCSQHDSTSA